MPNIIREETGTRLYITNVRKAMPAFSLIPVRQYLANRSRMLINLALPAPGALSCAVLCKWRVTVVWWRISVASSEGLVYPPRQLRLTASPVIKSCEGVLTVQIADKPRGYQVWIISFLSVVGMRWEQDAQQAAPAIAVCVYQAGADLPVHVLSLPRAAAYQHDSYGRIGDKVLADLPADLSGFQVPIDLDPIF